MGALVLQHRPGRAAPGKRVGNVPSAGNWLPGFCVTAMSSMLLDANSTSLARAGHHGACDPGPGRALLPGAPYHLSYGIRVLDGFLIVTIYVVAACGPLLLSGYRSVAIFGIVNLVAVIIITRLTVSGFASVWCGWAALSSGAVTLHCRFAKPHPQRARSGADELTSTG